MVLQYYEIVQIQVGAQEKTTQGFATIVKLDCIKQDPLTKLKISSFGMIPYKSRQYRDILDFSFALKLPSVNEASKEKATSEALDQVGTVMPYIIEALAIALLSDNPIQFSKLDIKDGFLRMVCAVGEEWNFAYVLSNCIGTPI